MECLFLFDRQKAIPKRQIVVPARGVKHPLSLNPQGQRVIVVEGLRQCVADERGVCPTGWHVPQNDEWDGLSIHAGGDEVSGHQLKSSQGWFGGGNGSNASGFSGKPGGARSGDGHFGSAGYEGKWWSATPYPPFDAWLRTLSFEQSSFEEQFWGPRAGLSVRCIQNAE